jgi:hypothetical protein
MQVAVLFCGLGLACATTLSAQGAKTNAGSRPDRITNNKYRFSVMFPPKWFVYDGGDVPAFFNFRPELSVQGELPPGGASICMLVTTDEKEQQSDTALSKWAEQKVKSHHGGNVERRVINGPVETGASPALRVSLDSPALSPDLQSLRYVIVFWQYKGTSFGLELSYAKDDPNATRYENVLLEVMRSFRPT